MNRTKAAIKSFLGEPGVNPMKEVMESLALIGQAVAIIAACWAIISGVGAWKREFIGKRRIELAEEILASFFEIKDAISYIRNPFSSGVEGKTRKKVDHESKEEEALLDRGYIVFERYENRKDAFVRLNTLKYKFMASFGHESEEIFVECNRIINSIFISARQLATHYWQRQGKVQMEDDEFQRHLAEMYRHEGVFWDRMDDNDEIRKKLEALQQKLDELTRPCFEEPVKTYSIFTTKWFVSKERMKERKDNKADNIIKHLLYIEEKDLRLKFIFDHVRNYGISASVMVAGFYLFANGAVVNDFPGAGIVFGSLLLFSGFLLMVFNLMQPIWAMVQYKLKMLPYMISSIVLFLAASELVWIFVKQAMSK
jgi:ABC-type multidrug transport system fused ATPase/permease subunit